MESYVSSLLASIVFMFLAIVKRDALALSYDSGNRIINGQNADIKQHPWVVALIKGGKNSNGLCGGTIIGTNLSESNFKAILNAKKVLRNCTNLSNSCSKFF